MVRGFIQWKGTDVCLDVPCSCGALVHVDGFFAYTVRCPHCGTVWRLPTRLPLVRVDTPDPDVPCVDAQPDDDVTLRERSPRPHPGERGDHEQARTCGGDPSTPR